MIKPINNRILVRPEPETHSLLIIPDSYRKPEEEPIVATVVALGKRNRDRRGRDIPWSVNPGEKVLLVGFMGAEVMTMGAKHLVVKEKDILAVLIPKVRFGLWCSTHNCESDEDKSCQSAWARQGIKGGILLPCKITTNIRTPRL